MPINDQFPSGLRILVVDDDTSCLFILEKMLLRLMYQGLILYQSSHLLIDFLKKVLTFLFYLLFVVTICSQADVALTILRERKDSFDLVLSDVHMPGMNGYNLLQQVGLLEMDLPVISKTLLLCFVSKD